MAISQRYRKITAAVLLLIYAFVATPTQWWHHHKNAEKETAAVKSVVVQKSTHAVSEANCPICNHTYSVYDGDAGSIVIPVITSQPLQNGHYTLSFFSSPLFSLSNKGPPSLA